ncbi:MAG: SDR family NAD(P)-dependent oxidoreductase [Chloroflexi bacterium]|nr:SDR family NAD(P)-dependent oxidoreductase [Chloroflexota bacterium]NOG65908.1 SDR family NAD(P)-dependent oxidoreductase [Chloroflexota bacterium]
MPDLKGKVAIVTGASRGVGKGIAWGLCEAGATVYITGRTVVEGTHWLPGNLHQAAKEANELAGTCIAVQCDHTDDKQVAALFEQVMREQGRIDVLVNNVWGGYEIFGQSNGGELWFSPFWTQPIEMWDKMFASGVRAHYTASQHAARVMTEQKSGLIVNISYWAGQKFMNNVAYGVAKTATDRMARDMAHNLQPHNVAAVCLYPGLVRTESVMGAAQFFDLSNSESPQFAGRAVAHLAADPDIMAKTGQVLVIAQLALDYGFTDIDGKQPMPLTLETA